MNSRERRNPYPGLRPFSEDETLLFFGRDRPARELVGRLGRNRFLAVIGASGSGKSSLVRCGVLPALKGGLIVDAGHRWRVAGLRPGGEPIGSLARSLASNSVLGSASSEDRPASPDRIEELLRRSDRGLLDAIRQAPTPEGDSVLVLVDQFEELFRYGGAARGDVDDESIAFVKLLLRTVEEARSQDLPFYVMITMRSDFIGDCMLIRGLPDAINSGSYLIPSMTREERREAIEGPADIRDVSLTPRLVQRILNDVGENLDQLPIMQHALMRTWDEWAKASSDSEPVDIEHYEVAGGIANALSRHAGQTFSELSVDRQNAAEGLFKAITTVDEKGRRTRRPTRLEDIVEISEQGRDGVASVVESFGQEGRSFLTPAAVADGENPFVDISHESLIRNWRELTGWVDEEAVDAAVYEKLARAAADGDRYWVGTNLQAAIDWDHRVQPTPAWAGQYDGDLEDATRFLRLSKRWDRVRRWSFMSAAALVALVAGSVAVWQRVAAEDAERAERVQFAAALEDPLASAVALSGLLEESWLHGLLGVDSPPDVDQVIRETIEAGIPTAALMDANEIEQVAMVAFASDDSTVLVAAKGDEERIISWPAGRSSARVAMGQSAEKYFYLVAAVPGDSAQGGDRVLALFEDGSVGVWTAGVESDSVVLPESVLDTMTLKQLGSPPAAIAAAFDPGGSRLAVSYGNGALAIWDLELNDPPLPPTPDTTRYLKFSPDGSRLLAADGIGGGTVYSVGKTSAGRDTVFSLFDIVPQDTARIVAAAFSPDGSRLATASGTYGRIWSVADGELKSTLEGHFGRVRAVAFSGTGRSVVTASNDGDARLWTVSDTTAVLKSVLRGHERSVTGVVFDAGSRLVLTTSLDGTARIWDVGSGRVRRVLHAGRGHVRAAFNRVASLVVTGAAIGGVRVWPVEPTRLEEQRRVRHGGGPLAVALGPEDTLLVTGSMENSTALVWDLRPKKPDTVGDPFEHPSVVLDVAFSPDDSTVATASSSSVFLWRPGHATASDELSHDTFVDAVAFGPEGAAMYTGTRDGSVWIWDLAARTDGPAAETSSARLSDPGGRKVNSIDVASDGDLVLVGYEGDGIRLWTRIDNELTFMAHKQEERVIRAVAVSPARDHMRLNQYVTADADGPLIVWRLGSPDPVASFAYPGTPTRVAFSGDGTRVMASGSAGVLIFDALTGSILERFVPNERVHDAVIGSDGSLRVTASEDGTALVWPVPWREQLEWMRCHTAVGSRPCE